MYKDPLKKPYNAVVYTLGCNRNHKTKRDKNKMSRVTSLVFYDCCNGLRYVRVFSTGLHVFACAHVCGGGRYQGIIIGGSCMFFPSWGIKQRETVVN